MICNWADSRYFTILKKEREKVHYTFLIKELYQVSNSQYIHAYVYIGNLKLGKAYAIGLNFMLRKAQL